MSNDESVTMDKLLSSRMREPVNKFIVNNTVETAKYLEMIRASYSNDITSPTNIDIFKHVLEYFVNTKLKSDPANQWIDFQILNDSAEEVVRNSNLE